MPLFFFHRTDGFVDLDDTGTELANLDAARTAAVLFTAESLRDEPSSVRDGRDFRVEVTDEAGALLLTIVTLATGSRAIETRRKT